MAEVWAVVVELVQLAAWEAAVVREMVEWEMAAWEAAERVEERRARTFRAS